MFVLKRETDESWDYKIWEGFEYEGRFKNKQKQIKVDYNCIVFIFCFFYKSSFVEKKELICIFEIICYQSVFYSILIVEEGTFRPLLFVCFQATYNDCLKRSWYINAREMLFQFICSILSIFKLNLTSSSFRRISQTDDVNFNKLIFIEIATLWLSKFFFKFL